MYIKDVQPVCESGLENLPFRVENVSIKTDKNMVSSMNASLVVTKDYATVEVFII